MCRFLDVYRVFFSIMLIFISLVVNSQSNLQYVQQTENQLKQDFAELFKTDSISFILSDEEKVELSGDIAESLGEIIKLKESFYYDFKIKQLGEIRSEDRKLKIYTWNIKLSDNSQKYYGFIQYLNNKKSELVYCKLEDNKSLKRDLINRSLKCDEWYGALYYKIIDRKTETGTLYTLFGWNGNNLITNRKIIDVLSIIEEKFWFGKAVFVIGDEVKKRLYFEYSNKTVMSLTYDKNLNMIIYDYLSPPKPIYIGAFQYYGPDGSYDGLKYEYGKWKHYSNIDIDKLKNEYYTKGEKSEKFTKSKRIYNYKQNMIKKQ